MASGHLEKRSKKGWTIVIDYGRVQDPVTGKWKQVRRRKALKNVNKTEAQKVLNQTLADINRGKPVETTADTVAEYSRKWLQHTAAPSVAKKTLEGYEFNVEKRVIPAFGHLQMTDVTPNHIRKLYASMRKEGLKNSTIRRVHVLLNSIFGQAVKDEDIYRNPVDAVKPPKEEPTEKKAFTPEEVERIMAIAQSIGKPRKRDGQEWLCTVPELLHVALYTGMRRGEQAALLREHVNLDAEAPYLDVEWSFVRVKGDGQYATERKRPKSKKSVRRIYFGTKTAEVFAGLLARNPHRLVFCHTDGSPLCLSTISHIFKRIAREAGMPEASFHSQRHTFCTNLLEAGADIATVQDMAGHASITTTRMYVHVVDERKRRAAELLESHLGTGKRQISANPPEKQEAQL